MASSTRDHSGIVVLTAPPALDLASREAFRKAALERVGKERPKVLVDLSPAEFIDSEGLGALISLARVIHERGGELRFCAPSPAVERLFRVTRLYFVFETYSRREEAIESF